MDSYTETAYAYTGAKLAPRVALWSYLTNSGRYAQYKAAEQAFNEARATKK